MHEKRITVGAYQFAGSASIQENLEAVKRGVAEAGKAGVRLLLFQECALSGYPPVERDSISSLNFDEQNAALEVVRNLSSENAIYIVVGYISQAKKQFYNSLELISPDGMQHELYHKRALWGWDVDNFKLGNNKGIYTVDDFKIGLRICYEVRFPELFRELYQENVDIALVSFVDIGKQEQQKKVSVIQSHLVSRAAENVFHVVSSNSLSQHQLAPTIIINRDGYVETKAPLDKEALIVHEIIVKEDNFGQRGRIENSNRIMHN